MTDALWIPADSDGSHLHILYDEPQILQHATAQKPLVPEHNEHTGEYDPIPNDPFEAANDHDSAENTPDHSQPGDGITYSDKHVILDASRKVLTIKHYLILHPTRRVDLTKVMYVLPASEVCPGKIGIKSWGMGPTGILWARDLMRGLTLLGLKAGDESVRRSFVLKCEGDLLRAGFTVEMREKFLEALEGIVPEITTRRPAEDHREGYERLRD